MKGINIWNAETFERQASKNQVCFKMPIPITIKPDGVLKAFDNYWVKRRPIGIWNLKHRLHCALEVFKGKADIIYFHKQ